MCALAGLSNSAHGAPNDGTVGPGEARAVIVRSGCKIEFTITPNLGGHIASTFRLKLTQAGHPVRATVSAVFTMEAMEMPSLYLLFRPKAPGIYEGAGEKLTMPGRWQIRLRIVRRHELPFDVILTDIASVE